MASGDSMAAFTPATQQPPASNFAVLNTLNSDLELDFDNSTSWSAVFRGLLPRNYSGNGVTVSIYWTASSTSGNVGWAGSFERNQAGTTDMSADHFAAEQSTTSAAPGTANFIQTTTIAFTNGAQMNSIAAGETFRFKLRRDTTVGSNMAAIAKVFGIEIKET